MKTTLFGGFSSMITKAIEQQFSYAKPHWYNRGRKRTVTAAQQKRAKQKRKNKL